MHTLHLGDCLDILPTIPAQSVDAIIADPPYGTTACKWDSVIPLAPMWAELKRVIKPRGAIVLFAAQPFTSVLIMSNLEQFKYEWIWNKKRPTDFFNARNRPMRVHENVCVFSDGTTANRSPNRMPYYPQGLSDCEIVQNKSNKDIKSGRIYGVRPSHVANYTATQTGFPHTRLDFSSIVSGHPTQKPVELLRYLIRTYTNPGETVLDFTMGSGTTGVAALQEGRQFVGIEKDAGYFDIARTRIEQVQPALVEAY
jgi:site-specific DNA-methyltransferase (adenine-specific)